MAKAVDHEERSFARWERRDAGGKPGTIAIMDGSAVVYNSFSQEMFGFKEQFIPGVFKDSLGTEDLRALIDHNSWMICGCQSAQTLRIADSDRSLDASVDMPDTSYSRDAIESIKRKDMGGMSFAFDVVKDEWEYDKAGGLAIRTVIEAKIYEVTITAFPAYVATSVSIRSMFAPAIARMEARLPKSAPSPSFDFSLRKLRWNLLESEYR